MNKKYVLGLLSLCLVTTSSFADVKSNLKPLTNQELSQIEGQGGADLS